MDYKFLVKKELEEFFENTELSVGEIFRSILSEKFSGVVISNKSRLTDLSDKEWYEIVEKSFDYEIED